MLKKTGYIICAVMGAAIVLFFKGNCFSQTENRASYRQEMIDTTCDARNPRYCSECKDLNKRDFVKCDEVDYRAIDLLKSNRVPESPYLPPDYAVQAKQVVFAANIGDKNLKSEIFIAARDKSVQTQSRLTWDADANCIYLDPFFTTDGKITFTRIDPKNKTEEYFLIENIQSGKRVKITRQESDSLYLAAHKNPGK